ncbi:unnamed protein product, partial [Rotaria sp. Silwood1]
MTSVAIQQILELRDSSIPKDSLFQHSLPDESVLDMSDFPNKCGILSHDEIIITESYTASQLVPLLAKGELTAEQVIKAYLKRAGIAHQLMNCATE